MKNLKVIWVFLIFMVYAFMITYSVFGETVNELQTQKDELTNQIEDANNQLSSIQDNINGVSAQLERLNEQIAKYQEELNISNVKVAQTQMSVNAITTELEEAEKKYTYQKNLLEQRLVAMYEAGDTVYLDVLLSASSIEDFLSKFYYLSKMAAYDQKLMKEVSNAKQDIAAKKILLERELAKLTEEKEKNEKLLITFENTKVVRNNYLNELTEKEKAYQERIELYEDAMDELEDKILKATLENISADYIGGEMAWPTPGYATITSGYGMRIHPIFGVYRLHTGVDIGAPLGASTIAVNDGVVILASYSSSYGNYVMIDHGGGVITLYAHGSKICVEVGQEVKKGDEIMLVGSTGWSTGPHLHFEVRIDGQTYDPLPYITSNRMPSTNEDEYINENSDNENKTVNNEIENNNM